MLIALDYDGTYTLDCEFWNTFILNAKEKDYQVICVTMRYDNEVEATEVLNSIGKLCKVIFTGRHAKKEFANDMKIFPDIWIDDNPYWILADG